MFKKHHINALIALAGVAVFGAVAAADFLEMHHSEVIVPSPALTKTGHLSDYFAPLRGSAGDADVYFYDSGVPGGTALILGGTHPNEAASNVAATLIAENIAVAVGRVLVVLRACNSGATCTDPFEAYPQFFTIKNKDGNERIFRFGSRVANPLDQWPDPLVYTHFPSGQRLSGFEARNLNRSYPGRPDGTFSEKVAYAIMQMIEQENIDISFDLHEAAPEIPIINAIVYHEKGEDIALNAVLELEMMGLQYSPELSPDNFRGLSHREWGDRTRTIPFLMEVSNPIQGRLRGKTNADLITKGVSNSYKLALESGALRIEYDPEGEPLDRRVARHVQGIITLIEAYNVDHKKKIIELINPPHYQDIIDNGIGYYLH